MHPLLVGLGVMASVFVVFYSVGKAVNLLLDDCTDFHSCVGTGFAVCTAIGGLLGGAYVLGLAILA